MDAKLTWGDVVQISPSASSNYRPSEKAVVCGMRTLANTEEATAAGFPEGTTLYLIEFSDGSSLEIPSGLVIKVEE
jgi:hypothetical protein